MSSARYRILVVDDEVTLNQFISTNLLIEGYEVDAAYSAQQAYEKIASFSPHLILLDVMMPNTSGLEVLQHVRSRSRVPVMMVTARISIQDRVAGLNLGADDYLVKPFSIDELTARVNALLRRSYPEEIPDGVGISEVLETGGIRCDAGQRRAFAAGYELTLQNLEFKLLCAFMRSPGRILTYDYLMSAVWEGSAGSIATLRVTIGKLRTKLKDAAGIDPIETVHGVGYRLIE